MQPPSKMNDKLTKHNKLQQSLPVTVFICSSFTHALTHDFNSTLHSSKLALNCHY